MSSPCAVKRRDADGAEAAQRFVARPSGRRHRRHRGSERRTDAARVVVGDPDRQPDDVVRQKRLASRTSMIGLMVRAGGASRSAPVDDAAGQDAAAERHEHARADGRDVAVGGHAVGEASSAGTGTATRTRRMCLRSGPARSRTLRSSCGTLPSSPEPSPAGARGLSSCPPRRRACDPGCAAGTPGWNVGISFAPR